MTKQEEPKQQQSFLPVIHRGAWVLQGLHSDAREFTHAAIEDGALVVAGGMIKAVGRYSDIVREFNQYPSHEHEGRVLAPALVNGHCHLELSHLDFAGRRGGRACYHGDLAGWIRDLLAAREKFLQETTGADAFIFQHARQTLQNMSAAGVAFVGDIGNSLASRSIAHEQTARVCFLLELLGLTRESETKSFARLENISAENHLATGCTAHAPYSTTPALIQALKKKAQQQGQIFSIHVAESNQEVEFLQSGKGNLREFLRERGAWDGSFEIPGRSSVHYLESLGVIDNRTLCVHGVHLDDAEIEILAKRKAKVCLCPGSNRFIGVGRAPVPGFLSHGILPALGTDSRSSNTELSMWREMRLLREDHPGLSPESVFAMATLGGAEAWNVADAIGSLEPGKQARVLKIRCTEKMRSSHDVFEYLTTAGNSVQVDWLE